MEKNLYYRSVFQRHNVLWLGLLTFFYSLSSAPRLLLEVFIRKDFGERYFKLSVAVILTVVLAVLPLPFVQFHFNALMPRYLLWYLYLAAFMVVSVKHHLALKRNPSVFDFAKFSLYTGKISSVFYRFHLPDRATDIRRIECLFEPAAFFIVGLALSLVGQGLGGLLMVCSVFYGFSYVAAYTIGDNFVMDKIDQMICNEELEKSFVDDEDEDNTRGFRFRGSKPNGKDLRRKLLPLMGDKEETMTAR